MIDETILKQIALLPFDGNAQEDARRGRGPRRDYLWQKLAEAGLRPAEDSYGNVWVERGSIGEYRLHSSHMDVDLSRGTHDLKLVREGDVYCGILDNAVGCYLNLLAALRHSSDSCRTFYVFTASEEEEPGNPDNWARSAQDVITVLQHKGVQPELCIAVDVTYPKLLVSNEFLNSLSDKEWDSTPADQLFDQNDRTHCYIDSISRQDSGMIAQTLVDRYPKRNIKIRDLTGFDEASVYSAIAPSFAVGPVGYGKYTEQDQRMPAIHIETVTDFLLFIVRTGMK